MVYKNYRLTSSLSRNAREKRKGLFLKRNNIDCFYSYLTSLGHLHGLELETGVSLIQPCELRMGEGSSPKEGRNPTTRRKEEKPKVAPLESLEFL